MQVLIVEDEPLAAERLSRMLLEIDPAIQIAGICSSIVDTVAFLECREQPDLILADIELSDGQCFEIFKRVRVTSAVIFTTSYNEFALQAFQANSIDYLLKPIRRQDLEHSIGKYSLLKQQFFAAYLAENLSEVQAELKKDLQGNQFRKSFLVRQGQRFIPVETEHIAYFFAEGRLTYLITWDKKKLVLDHTLEEIETMLDNQVYYRANRAFLLNRKAIRKCTALLSRKLRIELEPGIGKEVTVSREKASGFKEWLGK